MADFVEAFGSVIETLFNDSFYSTLFFACISLSLTFAVVKVMGRIIFGDGVSFLDFFKRKEKDKVSSDIAENIQNSERDSTEQVVSPLRHITVYNVMLDKTLFEFIGEYAKEYNRDHCTIYYTENDEHKQFVFDVTDHIAVYEDIAV